MRATKRGSRLRGPFVVLLVSISIILGFSYFNFEALSDFSTYVIPRIVQNPCNGWTANSSRLLLDNWSPRPTNESCSQPCECKMVACPPTPAKVITVEKIVEKVVVQEKVVEKPVIPSGQVNQWWAEGKPWHNQGKFPLCSMDACFNYTRCQNMDDLLVYYYDTAIPPVRYFEGLNSTPWYTPDPDKACLFFVFLDRDSPWADKPDPTILKHWNHGFNHVLVSFADLWRRSNPAEESIEMASVLGSGIYETTYRPGFDIGVPLPGKEHARQLQNLKSSERKYLLTFKGTRYLGPPNAEGVIRSFPSFRNMHNGKDVIVVTSCIHQVNDEKRKVNPELGEWCDEDLKLYDQYEFQDLMNTTFSLAPAGISGSSYRFIEILSAGAIPVLLVDNHVKPFENIIEWPRCILQFPTSEVERVIPGLRGMSSKDIEERQKYCLWVYDEFLRDDATLLRSVIRALKARFYGVFPKFYEMSPFYPGKKRRKLQ